MMLAYCRLEGLSGHQAAYALLEALYRRETGQALPPILRTDRGKPYFAQGGLHFSISHTPRHAVCVLARENVAVDAEELDRTLRPGLAEKILSPGEYSRYCAAKNPAQALLRLWVLKEAAAKLTGEGLRGYPNHTDFSPEDSRLRQLDGCQLAILGGDETPLQIFHLTQEGRPYAL